MPGSVTGNEATGATFGREIISTHQRFSERRRDDYRLIVLPLVYAGVRFGELARVRVSRLDVERRRAIIAESVTLVRSEFVFGTPKGHERREVPIPLFLLDELKHRTPRKAAHRPRVHGYTFRRDAGGPVFRDAAFDVVAAAISKPGLHPHELRHTAASLAIATRAEVKVVLQIIGHASAAMTLDQYVHLFGDRFDEVADRMASAREAAVARALVARTLEPHRWCRPAGGSPPSGAGGVH